MAPEWQLRNKAHLDREVGEEWLASQYKPNNTVGFISTLTLSNVVYQWCLECYHFYH